MAGSAGLKLGATLLRLIGNPKSSTNLARFLLRPVVMEKIDELARVLASGNPDQARKFLFKRYLAFEKSAVGLLNEHPIAFAGLVVTAAATSLNVVRTPYERYLHVREDGREKSWMVQQSYRGNPALDGWRHAVGHMYM